MNDETAKPSGSLEQVGEQIQAQDSFARAHAAEEGVAVPEFGSDQVAETQPTLSLDPPDTPRAEHWASASRDHLKAREQQQAAKAAFLARQAFLREQNPQRSRDVDRGRE